MLEPKEFGMNLESGSVEALLRKPIRREKRHTLAESLKPATKRDLNFQLMIRVAQYKGRTVFQIPGKQCSRLGFGSCSVH